MLLSYSYYPIWESTLKCSISYSQIQIFNVFRFVYMSILIYIVTFLNSKTVPTTNDVLFGFKVI